MTPLLDDAPNVFADLGADFDRCAERRDDVDWLSAQAAAAGSRYIVLDHSGRAAVDAGRQALRWFSAGELELLGETTAPLFLGYGDGRSYFSIATGAGDALPVPLMDLREAGGSLPAFEASLFAYAKAVLQWQHDTHYCARCGSALLAQASGHRLACTAADCGKLHFPRTDPAIIVIVEYQGACLLGRQAQWDPGRYSTLAGFVEAGESLEDAVRREVAEEAGVRVGAVRYHSSQPWPLPSSLMLGFQATAISAEIQLRDQELEDARWFTPQQLIGEVRAGRLRLPSPVSISHRLIADWLRQHTDLELASLIQAS